MKQLFFLICVFSAVISFSQTPLIAHKSHSGVSESYCIDPSSNFGIVQTDWLVQVIRLNDTTSIEVYDTYSSGYRFDTIYNNALYANYDLDLDSVKTYVYGGSIEFLNFRNSPDSIKPRENIVQEKKFDEKIEIEEQALPKHKKKNGNELLFLFLIFGGGMFVFRMLYKNLVSPKVV